MAPPEPYSPSPTSKLLPFLQGKPRRGSIASISSRTEVDKETLAQVLDVIHTSASKTDGLTSFHDYDRSNIRSGPKEKSTSGVTGLYNKLKQSVGSGSAAPREQRDPQPIQSTETASVKNASRVSLAATESPMGASLSAARPSGAAAVKNPRESPSTLLPSPLLQETSLNAGNRLAPSSPSTSTSQTQKIDGGPAPAALADDVVRSTGERVDSNTDTKPAAKGKSQEEAVRSGSGRTDVSRNDAASAALARVLHTHDASKVGNPPRQALQVSTTFGDPMTDSDASDGSADMMPDARSTSQVRGAPGTTPVTAESRNEPSGSQVAAVRAVINGESTLSSPAGDADAASISSSRTNTTRSAAGTSANINGALQRRRTGLKHNATNSMDSHTGLSSHLKRRVLSKEFWMQDANARACFSCGHSFSTFRRKHHCRMCGQIFDSYCTNLVSGRPFGQANTIRLCKPCETMAFADDDDDDSTVYSDDGEEPTRKIGTPMSPRRDARSNVDGPAFSGVDSEIATPSIGIPVSRRNREAKRRSAVIEFDTQPSLARPSSAHSLISLSRRPRSSSHRRRHSRHMYPGRGFRSSIDERVPFQQGLQDINTPLPAFHNDNIIDPDLAAFLSDDGSDDDDTPSIMAAVNGAGAASLNERERLGFGSLFTTGMKKGRSRGETAGSSTRGGKEEDTTAYHAKKLSRHRHHSRNNLSATLEIDPMDLRRPFSPQKPGDLQGAKVIRSSALRGENYPSVQMSPASLRHVKNLLAQLIDDSGIASPRAWEKALLPILLQCTIDVEPDVQRGDDMDIRHYIKLKKVPGGKPADTSYVSGVVFSKNIALKTMARSISQPRILIVTFAIEYARHETHFMSLDPVIAQEQEYLQNLVNRIAALRPNVLLVQRHVSGTALKLLERAGITVAYNIKESVLAAVARVTQTTLIKSIDKLGISHHAVTECDSFDVKTYVADGHRRTYIFLSGCQPDLGCTIVLRGADTDSLRKIKRVTEFMCYVAYNLKLEDWLMRDSNIAIPVEAVSCQLACRSSHGGHGLHPQFNGEEKPSAQEDDTQGRLKTASGKKTNFTYELIEKRNRSRLLSASPFVTFAQPYLLVQLRELEQNLARYRALTEQYAAKNSEKEDFSEMAEDTFELVRPETVNAPASDSQSKAIREYLHAVHQARLDKATFTFQMQERQWDAFMNGDGIDPYDPFWHQKIVVLFSLVSSITSAPCSGPEILGIVYYTGLGRTQDNQGEDMPLGQYVEDLCFAASSTCQDCGKKMYDHHRQYVHGFGQLTVSIQRQATKKYGNSDIIWMWSACRECRQETIPTQMSQHTWKYSFAKYLELSFWSNPLGPRTGSCTHDIHKDYLRYFSFRGMVVRFRYDSIDIYDVVAPRALVTWAVETDLVMKNEQYTLLEQRLESFTDSIRKRLDSINIDTLDEKKALEAQDVLAGLRERAEHDHDELLHKLQQKYSQSRYYELVPLNRALRMMDEKAIAWDESFNDFERDYFPSETDIRKLATIQLRNMFLESQPQPTRANSESDTEEGAETPIAEKQPEQLSTSASDEALPPKTEEVLSSTVVEQKAAEKTAAEAAEAGLGPETPLGNEAARATSPRKELEEAVEREDVKHLDLAIPYWNGDDNGTSPRSNSIHDLVTAGRSPSPAGQAADDSFATQPKPLSSGLLERIEQIRSSQAAGELEIQDSKIPRLADLRKAESSRTVTQVPPLLRAKSQPSHVPRVTDDYNNTEDEPAKSIQASETSSQNEKRSGDRLHLGRLAMKVGSKVAPSLIPRSIPFSNASHVSALAKHFEQMSREFEKERLREKRQRALRRQARANPLASSQPVVEVYRNATDAVGEKGNSNEPEAAVSREDFAETPHSQEPSTEATPTETLDDTRSSVDMSIADESVTSEVPTKIGSIETGTADEASDSERVTRRRKSSDPYSGRSPSTVQSPPSVADTTESVAESGSELTIPDHKKHAWLKYLAEFWSKRTASGWASLEYPLHGNEHVFEDSDIIVREDEPSSVIALTLACSDYRNKLDNIRTQTKKQTQRTAFRAPATELSEPDGESDKAGVEASLLSESATHLKYSFSHGTFKSSCKIFYAESFDALRRKCGVADRFIESMSRCLKFDSKGGKSKSLFLRTLDGRFVIKSLQEVELKAFTKFAPDYFAFMSYTLFHGVPSVIAKMFGLFQVNIRNPATGIEFSYNLLIMENLFYERNPNRRFDLKGSMRNRKIESTGEADEVLLDENLVETIFESPLFVREHSRKHLQASVFNDTLWLCKQNVMDYSLMAGFDDGSKELVVGIIDCIRTYTWDKKLESWIKDRGKNKPTITSPKDYRNRFRVSMMQYVLQAPTCWHQFQVNMAPPKTLREREERGHEEEEGEGRVE